MNTSALLVHQIIDPQRDVLYLRHHFTCLPDNSAHRAGFLVCPGNVVALAAQLVEQRHQRRNKVLQSWRGFSAYPRPIFTASTTQ
ncbi:MAG: hypothetical protein R8K20_06400 [Gallionellaceae bacterium]